MRRMIGKVNKSKKVWVIVRHSEDIKVVIATSNHIGVGDENAGDHPPFWPKMRNQGNASANYGVIKNSIFPEKSEGN